MTTHSLYLVEMFSAVPGNQTLYVSQPFFDALSAELKSYEEFFRDEHVVDEAHHQVKLRLSGGTVIIRGPRSWLAESRVAFLGSEK